MPRRIVTGHTAEGRSAVLADGPPPRSYEMKHTPGMASALVWATPREAAVPWDGVDPTLAVASFVPEAGATRLLRVVFPPDTVFASEDFDPLAAAAEQSELQPGLAEAFEPDSPGMHTTDSVDYGVLLSGEIVLDLGGGEEVTLAPGDIAVQNGTRHAWRNRTGAPATMVFVLVGARRASR